MSSNKEDTPKQPAPPVNPVLEALTVWLCQEFGFSPVGITRTIAEEKVARFLHGYPAIARAEHARTLLLDIRASARVYQGSVGEYFAAIGEGK